VFYVAVAGTNITRHAEPPPPPYLYRGSTLYNLLDEEPLGSSRYDAQYSADAVRQMTHDT
jgi:hypothetical protein